MKAPMPGGDAETGKRHRFAVRPNSILVFLECPEEPGRSFATPSSTHYRGRAPGRI